MLFSSLYPKSLLLCLLLWYTSRKPFAIFLYLCKQGTILWGPVRCSDLPELDFEPTVQFRVQGISLNNTICFSFSFLPILFCKILYHHKSQKVCRWWSPKRANKVVVGCTVTSSRFTDGCGVVTTPSWFDRTCIRLMPCRCAVTKMHTAGFLGW